MMKRLFLVLMCTVLSSGFVAAQTAAIRVQLPEVPASPVVLSAAMNSSSIVIERLSELLTWPLGLAERYFWIGSQSEVL